MRKALTTSITGILCFLGAGMSAHADQFTFNFNPLASGALSGSIQSYMNGVMGAGKSVTVTGAVADQTYSGEGFVAGPGFWFTATSLTLGNTDGATSVNSNSPLNSSNDTFIANTDDNSHQVSSQIIMVFQGLTIGSVSFDYEIFPDGTSSQPPDFKFNAGPAGSTSPVLAFGTNGVMSGVVPGNAPYSTSVSPNHPFGGEPNAQLIGHWSGALNNATELDFIDWPATIGIDNLVITTNTSGHDSVTPEPGAIFLLGTLLVGLFYMQKKKLLRARLASQASPATLT